MIFALTEPDNPGMPQAGSARYLSDDCHGDRRVGGSLTMDAVNPGVTLGPRLFAYVIGFWANRVPRSRGNEWWLLHCRADYRRLIGAAVYRLLVRSSCLLALELRSQLLLPSYTISPVF